MKLDTCGFVRWSFEENPVTCTSLASERVTVTLGNGDQLSVGVCRLHGMAVRTIQWADSRRSTAGPAGADSAHRGDQPAVRVD